MTDAVTSKVVPEQVRANPDQRALAGAFDIVGDVHGCCDELIDLLGRLGYRMRYTSDGGSRAPRVTEQAGRRVVFVGDLTDRGPASAEVLRIVMGMVADGVALAVPGNHDVKLARWIRGHAVTLGHGLELTVAELERESADFREEVGRFIMGLPIHLWLDKGALAVSHAGLKEEMLGRDTKEIRAFCLYGETKGEKDEMGLPIRYHWAAEYRGSTAIVYGHTPVPDAEWLNNTLCVDTGCCFGGKLTALRWPELEILSVPAREAYAAKRRPFGHPPVRPGVEI